MEVGTCRRSLHSFENFRQKILLRARNSTVCQACQHFFARRPLALFLGPVDADSHIHRLRRTRVSSAHGLKRASKLIGLSGDFSLSRHSSRPVDLFDKATYLYHLNKYLSFASNGSPAPVKNASRTERCPQSCSYSSESPTLITFVLPL